MDLGLTDKVALVTGSYRGTGAGIARALAAEGAVVLVHGLEPGQADETAASILVAGDRALTVTGDIRTEEGTAAMVADVRATRVGVATTSTSSSTTSATPTMRATGTRRTPRRGTAATTSTW